MALLYQVSPVETLVPNNADCSLGDIADAASMLAADAQDGPAPCSNLSHHHASSACVGHYCVPPLSSAPGRVAGLIVRISYVDDKLAGRTLLPPVPPPSV